MKNSFQKLNVGIFIFDQVEVLDFAGPFEVFSRTRLSPDLESRLSDDSAPFQVFTIAKTLDPITAIGGLKIIPTHSFSKHPSIDILIIPGGWGTRALLKEDETLHWISSQAKKAQITASVCTGALLLAKLGLLKNRKATTHWASLDLLKSIDSSIQIQKNIRFVEDEIITSAGISAGIDMCFYLVEKICGKKVAQETARYMEYNLSQETLSK